MDQTTSETVLCSGPEWGVVKMPERNSRELTDTQVTANYEH